MEWGFCQWFNTIEDIEEESGSIGGNVEILEGETVDYCCDDYDEERDLWVCKTVPEGGDDLCYDYCVRYGLCNYFDWATTNNVHELEKEFCCKGVFDMGAETGATYPCAPISDNQTCQQLCDSDGLCTRTDLNTVDISKNILW